MARIGFLEVDKMKSIDDEGRDEGCTSL